jgi:hypothetical protein
LDTSLTLTWLALAGVGSKALMQLGGWADLSQVARYVNLRQEDLQQAISRLGNLQGSRERADGDDPARGEKQWRRRESNPRPEAFHPETLRA